MGSMTEKELLVQWGEVVCQMLGARLMEGLSLELRFPKTFFYDSFLNNVKSYL